MRAFKEMFFAIKNRDSKTKTVLINAAASFGIKGLALVVSLFTMPAYMRFFSNREVLGVWYTILSVLTWILSFDIGIGNGLRNKLSTALAQNKERDARAYISSAYWMIGLVVVVVLIIGYLLIPLANWNLFFNISESLVPADIMAGVVLSAFVGIMIQFFLRLISSILYAMQKSAVNNMIALLTSVIQLFFVLLAPKGTPVESLKMFSTAYIIISNLPLLVVTIVIFIGSMRNYMPSIRYVEKSKTKEIISLGGIFFLCQVLYMVIANTNEFFVSQYTGPENVVDYQIYYRLFSLGSMIITLALTPIWSIVTKALAEKDISWLSKLYKNLKKFTWLGILGEVLLIIVLQPVIDIWLGAEAIKVNYIYAISFALFGSIMMYQSMLSTIVCGMGKMKLQAVSYSIGIIAKFLIIHYGIKLTNSWIIIVLANVIILFPYCILQQRDLDKQLLLG